MASVYAFEAYLNWESTVQIVMDLDHLERVNLGNAYKYLHEYMDEQDFEELRTTYAIGSSTAQKDALQTMITLFERYAKPLAESYNYNYSEECEATKQYILNILEQRGIGMKSK
ncbi:aminoglycoside 6-adenylyltransferase [Kurthia sp. FSL E2-0154]|uniref:aminoglycoside 6-adenylyltransferase n=1 Tax=Kurthia sp. FSL E2-0154 TaxID=2921358 RepID=UPI0030F4BF6E